MSKEQIIDQRIALIGTDIDSPPNSVWNNHTFLKSTIIDGIWIEEGFGISQDGIDTIIEKLEAQGKPITNGQIVDQLNKELGENLFSDIEPTVWPELTLGDTVRILPVFSTMAEWHDKVGKVTELNGHTSGVNFPGEEDIIDFYREELEIIPQVKEPGGFVGPNKEAICEACAKKKQWTLQGDHKYLQAGPGWPRFTCEHCGLDF